MLKLEHVKKHDRATCYQHMKSSSIHPYERFPIHTMNPQNQNTPKYLLLIILSFCLIAVLMQGLPTLSQLPQSYIWLGCMTLFLPVPIFLFLCHKKGKLTEDKIVCAIIFSGMLFHCCYVLLSGLYDRQHDEGVYTGIATNQVNPGHIGYIEYIYKFRRLPDFNPYQLFSYYHPPLHYVLSGLWLLFLTALGMPEDLAFENLQTLPLLYSGLFMLLTYFILKKTGAFGKPFYTGLLLIAFHPALTIMSGSVNNDMLSALLLSCCIYAVLCWMREKTLKNLIFIALSIGFGMLCKINAAVIALPTGLIFLLDFIETIRTKDKHALRRSVRNYMLFGITAGSIGLSWIVRNFLRFHIKSGISSATESSVMYTGNYSVWSRIGIPAFTDWHFSFPFHPLSGDTIHNTWVIMFQTSLFAEVYPQELSGIPLLLCRIAYPLAILTAIGSAVFFLTAQYEKSKQANIIGASAHCDPAHKKDGFEALFLSAGYLAFLLSFAVFSLKYPYTCSSDFRYIVICLLYIAIGLADGGRLYSGRTRAGAASRMVRVGVWAALFLTTIIYIVWNQW